MTSNSVNFDIELNMFSGFKVFVPNPDHCMDLYLHVEPVCGKFYCYEFSSRDVTELRINKAIESSNNGKILPGTIRMKKKNKNYAIYNVCFKLLPSKELLDILVNNETNEIILYIYNQYIIATILNFDDYYCLNCDDNVYNIPITQCINCRENICENCSETNNGSCNNCINKNMKTKTKNKLL
jgi:hypothetical protein